MTEMYSKINKGDMVYYARVLPQCDVFEVCELRVRTVTPDYLVGVDKDCGVSYLVLAREIGEIAFLDRADALAKVLRLEDAFKKKGEKL